MKVASVSVKNFRRFTDLQVSGLPHTAKLVVLVGPNGGGKSALFDAMNLWHRRSTQMGYSSDGLYYEKRALIGGSENVPYQTSPSQVTFHGNIQITEPKFQSLFHVRTAYRHDADFTLQNLQSISTIPRQHSINRLIDVDTAVAQNYHRLVSESINTLYSDASRTLNIGQFQDEMIGAIRESFSRVFPETALATLGRPLVDGTFYFAKGVVEQFHYKNLSGGEKSVFDLLLDLFIRAKMDRETIYLIDEPELHTNAVIQRQLLEEMVNLVPESGQIWIATHSFGMLNAARKMLKKSPSSVVFLNFFDRDFDQSVIIEPEMPNRRLWQSVLRDSLDDLADLIAPSRIVFCEGATALGSPKEGDDAVCYKQIFGEEFPEVVFISLGSSSEVESNSMSLQSLVLRLSPATQVKHLHDRDEMTDGEISRLKATNGLVLGRRELESYLWDIEILKKFLFLSGCEASCSDFERWYENELEKVRSDPSVGSDEVKKVIGMTFNKLRRITHRIDLSSNRREFMKSHLAPLVSSDTQIYQELKAAIFCPADWE